MHKTSINFEAFVAWDNSPFILFSNQGKILYLNHTAEALFGYVSQKELYDIALSYASQSFGYKSTPLKLSYDSFLFHAITVGYENENEISLRLYHTPLELPTMSVKTDTFISSDINVLLEANISLFRIKNTNTLKLFTDPDLPFIKIDQNAFSKIVRRSLDAFILSSSIDISLKILISRHIIIDSKKIPIIILCIKGDTRSLARDESISSLCLKNHIQCLNTSRTISLEIPLIT
jgi:hypothetical protein